MEIRIQLPQHRKLVIRNICFRLNDHKTLGYSENEFSNVLYKRRPLLTDDDVYMHDLQIWLQPLIFGVNYWVVLNCPRLVLVECPSYGLRIIVSVKKLEFSGIIAELFLSLNF